MQFLAPNSRYETIMIEVDFEYQFVNQYLYFWGVVFYFNHHVYVRFRRFFAVGTSSLNPLWGNLGTSVKY